MFGMDKLKHMGSADELARQVQAYQTLLTNVLAHSAKYSRQVPPLNDAKAVQDFLIATLDGNAERNRTATVLQRSQADLTQLTERNAGIRDTVTKVYSEVIGRKPTGDTVKDLDVITKAARIGAPQIQYDLSVQDMSWNLYNEFLNGLRLLERPQDVTKAAPVTQDTLVPSIKLLHNVVAFVVDPKYNDLPRELVAKHVATVERAMDQSVDDLRATLKYSPNEGNIAIERISPAIPYLRVVSMLGNTNGSGKKAFELQCELYALGGKIAECATASTVEEMGLVVESLIDIDESRRPSFLGRPNRTFYDPVTKQLIAGTNIQAFNALVSRGEYAFERITMHLPNIDLVPERTKFDEYKKTVYQYVQQK